MTYFNLIETSGTWTCPTTGKYKIIAVAGGNGGGASGGAGGATSFGDACEAASQWGNIEMASNVHVGGMGGYLITGTYGGGSLFSNYGVAMTGNGGTPGCTGFGYGAGGGGTQYAGGAGKINMVIASLTAGQAYTCTIGAGGTAGTGGTAGASGCIIVQEV